MTSSFQPGLFDAHPDVEAGHPNAADGRARMRAMIDALVATVTPAWKDQMAVILQDGSFQRAMALVPKEEAQALWAEYDAHMERLYAVWALTQPVPKE